MINVSETAAGKISELLTEENKAGSGLRVFVQGGGCSGFRHGLMIEENGPGRGRPGVRVARREAVRGPDQHPYLKGARGRLRRNGHRRRLHDQEPERHVHLRLRLVVLD
jgi:iron-sulfur cluster insertion protein